MLVTIVNACVTCFCNWKSLQPCQAMNGDLTKNGEWLYTNIQCTFKKIISCLFRSNKMWTVTDLD